MSNTRIPDILECLSNLSNDEVFTTPALANQILDTLPKELWSNKNATFLDPFTKSGVFLREITKRLLQGLEKEIPDLQERINHILEKQVFGIATTELTSLVARRSVYCSKKANGEKAITDVFDDEQGNIIFKNLQHDFTNGNCKYCGANKKNFERSESLEQHAYPFIHLENPLELFKNMKFDVIVGNPPYQLGDGSGISTDAAIPIYNKFIEQAIKMNPQYLIMIVPSKWMVGGRGLQKFREKMMEDKRLKIMYDFENASDCFPGVHIDGGVCYFLWDKDYNGMIDYTFKSNKGIVNNSKIYLKNDYFEYVIRDNRILSILDKVSKDRKFSEIVSETKPYGIRKYLFNEPERYPESNLQLKPFKNSVKIYGVKGVKGGAKRIIGYINKVSIIKNQKSIDKYKLFFTTSYSTNAINPPDTIIGLPNEVCTETFLMVGHFDTEKEQTNCYNYINTDFFKTLLYYGKGTMQVTRSVFGLIPLQDFKEDWTDEKLYEKYALEPKEIAFIESLVKLK